MGKLIDLPRFFRFLGRLFSGDKAKKVSEDVKTWLDIIESIKDGNVPTPEQMNMLKGILGWTDEVIGKWPEILADIKAIQTAFSDFKDDLNTAEEIIKSIKAGNMPTLEQINTLAALVAEFREDTKTIEELFKDLQ